MKKSTAAVVLAAILAGQSAFAETERWSQQMVVSEQTVNDIIDAIIIIGTGKAGWEIWFRWIDRTPRKIRH